MRDEVADPVARLARSADVVVYAMAAVSALLCATMVGADLVPLALVVAAVVPLIVEAAGLRPNPALGGFWTLGAVAVAQFTQSPKMIMLIPVAMAAWVALRSASRTLNGAFVASAIGVSVLCYVRYDPPIAGSFVESGSVIWVAAILYGSATGYVLRRTRVLAEELSRAQHRLVAAAAADERRRIAQDVHDLVAHSLAVALLNVKGARRTMHRDLALADEALARAEAVGRESLGGIRQVVGLLRDPATGGSAGPLPDAHDLADLVAGYRRSGLVVSLDVAGSLETIDPVAGSVLFRTVREGLANVLHHADGAATEVRVEVGRRDVRVAVVNDLPTGWQQRRRQPRRGLGLTGVVERVNTLGGTVSAGADDGRWQLAAVIPTSAAVEAASGV
jgi:signal transduction histidine kinase